MVSLLWRSCTEDPTGEVVQQHTNYATLLPFGAQNDAEAHKATRRLEALVGSPAKPAVNFDLTPPQTRSPPMSPVKASTPRTRGPLARYREWESIRQALEDGDTILIKGDYVEQVYLDGEVLPPRQELPEQAIWKIKDLTEGVEDYRKPTPHIVAISHGWLTDEHPDPEGHNLSYFAPLLRHYAQSKKVSTASLAIFIDWCSLHQEPRTEEEEACFKRALGTVELWYSHWLSQVWLLTAVPDGVALYKERGWAHFEKSLAQMCLPPESVLDLGALRPTWSCWSQVARECQAKRVPPAAPEQFERELDSRSFKYEEDRELVVPKYADVFNEVMGSVTELWYSGLGWSDREAEKLALILPLCTSLKELELRGNIIADAGAYSLADVVYQCPSLQTLDLEGNILETEGLKEIKAAWEEAEKPAEKLLLGDQQTSAPKTAAAKKAAAMRAGLTAKGPRDELTPAELTSLMARQAAFEARIENAVQKLSGGITNVAESVGIREEIMAQLKHPPSPSSTQLRL